MSGNCSICGKTKDQARMDCHHIKNKKDYPTLLYEVDNGVLLCVKCHAEYENKPGQLQQLLKLKV
jgi:hypothetical protein